MMNTLKEKQKHRNQELELNLTYCIKVEMEIHCVKPHIMEHILEIKHLKHKI